jgi:hypothetical protein
MSRLYDPTEAEQHQTSSSEDIEPVGDDDRVALATSLAMHAVVYGLPAVYQYASMCAQCAPQSDGSPWTLNTLVHERDTADSGFDQFRVPNVDTVYSNAWLDLTDGPVIIELPDFGRRYYTLEFLDAHSNAGNISARTHPSGPRRIMVVAPGLETSAADAPADTVTFRVATPLMWLLMRIQVFGDRHDIETVRALQDAVVIRGSVARSPEWPVVSRDDVETSYASFLSALDTVLTINGVPVQDASHVHQFRQLNVGSGTANVRDLDAATARGAEAGFRLAMTLLDNSRSRLGRRTGSGWTRVLDKGAHGNNFLARAVMNFVGLGANVIEENCSYNTYVDDDETALTGADGQRYDIELTEPPPAQAFWSITLYDAATGWLYDAPDRRFSVGSTTTSDGAMVSPSHIVISHARPHDPDTDHRWLPAPPRPFFLVLRMYRPHEDAVTERWSPPRVHRSNG